MAKDARDNGTTDFIGIPGKRGRKPTGSAATAAERQAAYRQRKAAQGNTPTALVAQLQQRLKQMEREVEFCQRERSAAFQAADKLKEENRVLLWKLERATAGN